MKIFLGVLFISVWSANAHAVLPVSGKYAPKNLQALTAMGTDDYRLGDEWGKYPVTAEMMGRATPAFRRAAMATAKVGGATGFFLGKFNGELVMATNHHVYTSAASCGSVRFPLLNIRASCDKFYGSWPEVDLALFSVRLENPADEAKLMAVAGNFQFKDPVRLGEMLMTIGFGIAGNPGG
jgi:S1-C subfamily serine protease